VVPLIPGGGALFRKTSSLAGLLLLSLSLSAPALPGPTPASPPRTSFDFSDEVYRRQGIDPAKIRERLSGERGLAVPGPCPEPSRRGLRTLEWRGGYDAAGCTLFFHRFGSLGGDAFLGDPSGDRARRTADVYRVFTFPKQHATSRRLLLQDRQDPVFDTTPGSLSQNPLALWRVTTVVFTEKVFRSRPGLMALEEIRKRNGTDLDGTPILRNLSDIRNLEQRGFVALEQRSAGDSGESPWVIWPLVGLVPVERLPGDAVLALTMMDEGVAVEPMLEQAFLNLAQAGSPGLSVMPRLAPFVEPLPIPPVLEPLASLDPPPAESGLQGYAEAPPVRLFELHERAFLHRFHPDLPPSVLWGYGGQYPGPTIRVRRGEPFLLRVWNDLPSAGEGGIGQPRTVCRPELFPLASDSAGYPDDHYPPGRFKDHYCSSLRGSGDLGPRPATGRYRDGRLGWSAQNSYRGLAGLMIAHDAADSGDETDPDPRALRLPGGAYDVPLVLADKRFDETLDHALAWDPFDMSACYGDTVTVNGIVQPYLKVARRKYRFRLWNAGPSRGYALFLTNGFPFTLIAADGYLLEAPVEVPGLPLLADQVRDVVIDFSGAKLGTEVLLEDRSLPVPGRVRSLPGIPDPAARLLKFLVDRDAPDPSRIPPRLAPRPPEEIPPDLAVRTFTFSEFRGIWTLNGRTFDLDRADAVVRPGTPEIWLLKNESSDLAQVIRLPVGGRLLSPPGATPPRAWDAGPRDLTELRPGQEARLLLRTPSWPGRYVISSSDAIREDQGLIFRWDVTP